MTNRVETQALHNKRYVIRQTVQTVQTVRRLTQDNASHNRRTLTDFGKPHHAGFIAHDLLFTRRFLIHALIF
jgi:hypothetical protein